MNAIKFHDNWIYKRLGDDGPGEPVTLPHDAMLRETRSPEALGGKNVSWFEGYDYLYFKYFYVPQELANKTVIFEFEGVYRDAEVRLNGQTVGSRPYGYSHFYADVSGKLLCEEENLLEVVARNAAQPNSRWYSGAGIYRPVTMWVSEREHIALNGVRVSTRSVHPAEIEISVKTVGAGDVAVSIWDGEREILSLRGESDGEITFRTRIEAAKLWSAETPNLYLCRVAFGTDRHEEPFGIRTLSWGKDGLKINNQRVILRGACIHHDNGLLGAATYPDAEERRIRILKENGYNAVRSAHNPCSKALLAACDKLGMMMMDEFVDCWYIHKTEHDYVDFFAQWWKQDLRDMVDKDFNHPCVIMYSTGNEVSETAQPRGIELTGELTSYLHSLDNSRPVTCGINIFFNFLSSVGFGVYSDKKAKAELAKAERNVSPKEKAVGSEFFNNLAGRLGADFMKRGATLPQCDWKTRDAFAKMDIAGYNYGIYRYRHDLKKYPDRLILGSETFCKDAAAFYRLAQEEPRLIGDFVWAGMDYLGEVGVGAWEYGEYAPRFDGGPGWISAGSGRIDLTGKPLGEAAYTKTVFGLTDRPIIAVRPVYPKGERHSPSAWKMTNAVESWSWSGREGCPATVEVYSRGHAAALHLDGRLIGKKRLKDCRALFQTVYAPGELTVVSYDAAGKEIGRNALRTAEKETRLLAIPEKAQVKIGELAYIRIQYADRNGIIKPTQRGTVSVQVQGGKLLALGNGCPFNLRGYLNEETETYYGEALAIVQVTERGLTVTISDGGRRAEATVEGE